MVIRFDDKGESPFRWGSGRVEAGTCPICGAEIEAGATTCPNKSNHKSKKRDPVGKLPAGWDQEPAPGDRRHLN